MRISRRQWALTIAAALAIHAGIAIAVLWRPPTPGAAAAGMGGIAVALGPAGGAPGSLTGAGEALDNDDPAAGEDPGQADDPAVEAEADRAQPLTPQPEPADTADAPATPDPPPAPAPAADRAPAPKPPSVAETDLKSAEPLVETPAEPQVVAAAPRPKPSPPLAARSHPRPPASSASRSRSDGPMAADTLPQSGQDGGPRGDVAGAGGPAGTEARSDAGTASAAEGGGTPGATADYMAALRAWLERHKRYPRTAQLRRQEGVVLLSFVMDRNGRVLAHRLQQTSGHVALDREVEALIQRAQPLPPLPATMAQARLEVVVPIRFSLDG